MKRFEFLAIAAVVAVLAIATVPMTQAQAPAPPTDRAAVPVTAEVNVGISPECPYGYYDYAPYNCVPDGYYGPEWFTAGVFVGVGPWFHGASDFQGKVDNSFDPQHGYSGDMPKKGDK